MRDVIVSTTARDELRLITEYLSIFGAGTARTFAREFNRKIKVLQEGVIEFPIARHPDLAAAGYRIALVKNYLMLYKIADDRTVRVSHVFHQSQDYAALVTEIQ